MKRVPLLGGPRGKKDKMHTAPRHSRRILPVLTALTGLLATVVPAGGTIDPQCEEALLRLDAVLQLTDLSRDLWPSWDISDTPVLLHAADSVSYLVNHPDPPDGCESVPDARGMRLDVRTIDAVGDSVEGVASIAGHQVAVFELDELGVEAVPIVFGRAFRVHASERCPDAMDPVVLVPGYPVDPENLVLADIESELLQKAVAAPDESLRQRVCDFASVRYHRRLRFARRYGEYERQLEFETGIPAYLAERCRLDGPSYLDEGERDILGDCTGEPGGLERCLRRAGCLEWYRVDRFRWSGALVSCLMDRLDPGWEAQAASECVDPFELMWREVRGSTPRAPLVLARFDYEERIARKSVEFEDSRGEAERLFETIVQGPAPSFAISIEQLASAEVRYDPTQVARVDANRRVQRRLFKLECANGTHVHIIGRPVAIVTGDDEFDLRRLVVQAPESYRIELDGELFEATEGVHQFQTSLSVVADGFEIEASVGTVMVGASGISFMLHR
jgi:hypothetical protein